jgi:hypothetical protein
LQEISWQAGVKNRTAPEKSNRRWSRWPPSRWPEAETTGICQRFPRTVLDESYRVALHKKIYRSIHELQVDLDAWAVDYNESITMIGDRFKAAGAVADPDADFLDALPFDLTRSPLAKEKFIAA